jgi:hypothetical protein
MSGIYLDRQSLESLCAQHFRNGSIHCDSGQLFVRMKNDESNVPITLRIADVAPAIRISIGRLDVNVSNIKTSPDGVSVEFSLNVLNPDCVDGGIP